MNKKAKKLLGKKKSKKPKSSEAKDGENDSLNGSNSNLSPPRSPAEPHDATTTASENVAAAPSALPRNSESARRRKKKKAGGVRFAQVEVREYRRRHGGSSAVPEEGYIPLGLSWRHEDMKPQQIDEYEEKRQWEGRVSARSIDIVPMAERWRKLESGEERPSLELQSSARRSAQEIEAIRRSRNFHNRGCHCRGGVDCRTSSCPCFVKGDECFYKICRCRSKHCTNRLSVGSEAPGGRRRRKKDAADVYEVEELEKSSSSGKLRKKPTPARLLLTPADKLNQPGTDEFSTSSNDDDDNDAAPAPLTSSESDEALSTELHAGGRTSAQVVRSVSAERITSMSAATRIKKPVHTPRDVSTDDNDDDYDNDGVAVPPAPAVVVDDSNDALARSSSSKKKKKKSKKLKTKQ